MDLADQIKDETNFYLSFQIIGPVLLLSVTLHSVLETFDSSVFLCIRERGKNLSGDNKEGSLRIVDASEEALDLRPWFYWCCTVTTELPSHRTSN